MKQITKKLQTKALLQPVRDVVKSLIHCTSTLWPFQRKPPDCAKLQTWTDSVEKWGHRIYIQCVFWPVLNRHTFAVLLLPMMLCVYHCTGQLQCLWLDGLCGGGCGNISDSVFTWIVWHTIMIAYMRMPKSNMEYKAGSMQCRMDIIDVTGNLTSKQTPTDKSSCHVPHTGYGKCARKRNGKLNGKTDQNDHRHSSDGGNGAHSALTTASINC